MYCPHCKKEVAGNDGVCENCGDILVGREDEVVRKKRKKSRDLGHLPRYMMTHYFHEYEQARELYSIYQAFRESHFDDSHPKCHVFQ